MRQARKFVQMAGVFLLLAGAAFGQRMLEHAVTAAGGASAGVAGKPLSDAADKIFGKSNKGLDRAAATGQVEAVRKTPVDLSSDKEPPVTPGQPGAVAAVRTRRPVAPRPRKTTEWSRPASSNWQWQGGYDAMPPETTREELAAVHSGEDRSTVLAHLGRPSVRIFIPEDGELREVYYFSGQGRHLGMVELSNGVVQTVTVR